MILVTGAAGFIGSVIVKQLNDQGHESILVCDHFGQGDKWKNLSGLKYDSFVQVEDLFDHSLRLCIEVRGVLMIQCVLKAVQMDLQMQI